MNIYIYNVFFVAYGESVFRGSYSTSEKAEEAIQNYISRIGSVDEETGDFVSYYSRSDFNIQSTILDGRL